MASGIPLICSPWNDEEKLFSENQDYLLARDGGEMKERLLQVLTDLQLADSLKDHALRTILSRHTCRHRTAELLAIVSGIKTGTNQPREETDTIGKIRRRQEDKKIGRH
jgi:spore maturation protein CgeB